MQRKAQDLRTPTTLYASYDPTTNKFPWTPPPTSCLSTFFDPSLIFWIFYRTWSSAVIGIGTIGWNKILPHQREARSTADIGSLGTVSSLTRLLVLASQIGLVGAEGPSTALDVSPIDVSIGLGGSRTERSIP